MSEAVIYVAAIDPGRALFHRAERAAATAAAIVPSTSPVELQIKPRTGELLTRT